MSYIDKIKNLNVSEDTEVPYRTVIVVMFSSITTLLLTRQCLRLILFLNSAN